MGIAAAVASAECWYEARLRRCTEIAFVMPLFDAGLAAAADFARYEELLAVDTLAFV